MMLIALFNDVELAVCQSNHNLAQQ